jgi:aryl-alcohol dehydrogenase-like predicted oxidoreductase
MVSSVGFGGMHVSIEGRPSEDISIRVIHTSLDSGVTLIDTADVYCLSDLDIGHNERLIARALRGWNGPREQIVVATKGGLERPEGRWTNNGRPEHLFRACDASLKALGVERIDLYQLHAPDPRVPFKESVGALAELAGKGKVRWVGLSNVSVEEIEEARKVTPIVAVQNRLNPFFREALEEGVVEYCGREGLGFLAYSPAGGGRLNLKLPSHPVVKRIAERRKISAHAVVLAWVLAQGKSVIVIPSARTVDHAGDGARASDIELDEQELEDITAAEFPIR